MNMYIHILFPFSIKKITFSSFLFTLSVQVIVCLKIMEFGEAMAFSEADVACSAPKNSFWGATGACLSLVLRALIAHAVTPR